MSDQARGRSLGTTQGSALGERSGAARYEHYQREIRKGNPASRDGPRPQEFDENGFPIPQPRTSFLERVARLLTP